jgi:hypothetical protein
LIIIVGVQLAGPAAGSSDAATYHWHGVEYLRQQCRVGGVGGADVGHYGQAATLG